MKISNNDKCDFHLENDPERKNPATNTSKVEKTSQNGLYGDRTVSEILEKAKSEIRKIWDQSLRVILMKSKDLSNTSSDIYDDAQTSLPQTENQMVNINQVKRILSLIFNICQIFIGRNVQSNT